MDDRRTLNLGCGRKPLAGAVNLDCVASVAADVVHDLNVRPWPFPDGSFRHVQAFDVIEHLDDVVATMEEIYRICEDGATVEITVPHFSSSNAFTDPTHRHFFGHFTFRYFDPAHELGYYSSATFRVLRSRMIFTRSAVNRIVERLANSFPGAYESRWAWMFPAWFLSIQLQVVKGTQS